MLGNGEVDDRQQQRSPAAQAWIDGRIVPAQRASLSLDDAGFVWGASVADMCRTFHHRLFRWEAHYTRFKEGCKVAGIELRYHAKEIRQAAEQLLTMAAGHLAREEDLALVLVATPGSIGYYSGDPGGIGDGPPTFLMHTFPLPFHRYVKLIQEGATLAVADAPAVPAKSISPAIKHRSRMYWWLAQAGCRQRMPGSVPLAADEKGRITESATANFLAVIDGQVCSPPTETILPGVSRAVVRELCAELSIPFVERDLYLDDLARASEAMLTSTPYCIAPVNGVESYRFPVPGPICKRLTQAWSKMVGVDIVQQILQGR